MWLKWLSLPHCFSSQYIHHSPANTRRGFGIDCAILSCQVGIFTSKTKPKFSFHSKLLVCLQVHFDIVVSHNVKWLIQHWFLAVFDTMVYFSKFKSYSSALAEVNMWKCVCVYIGYGCFQVYISQILVASALGAVVEAVGSVRVIPAVASGGSFLGFLTACFLVIYPDVEPTSLEQDQDSDPDGERTSDQRLALLNLKDGDSLKVAKNHSVAWAWTSKEQLFLTKQKPHHGGGCFLVLLLPQASNKNMFCCHTEVAVWCIVWLFIDFCQYNW